MATNNTQTQSKQASTNKRPPLLAAYLFVGEDELKRKTLLDRLVARISEDNDLSFNTQTFEAANLKDEGVLLDSCYTLPFASNKRLVILNDVDKLNKQVSEALITYLKDPAESTVLVLIADSLKKTTRLYKAIAEYDQKCIISAEPKKAWDLPAMVKDLASNYGLKMDIDAAKILIDRVGNSTMALKKEVEKLASYALASGKKTLSCSDIAHLVAQSAEVSSWNFIDAVFSRDSSRALFLRKRLAGEQATSLLMLCVMRLRELISVRACMDRGIRDVGAIAREMRNQEWQVKRLVESASRFNSSELRTLLIKAANTSKALMSGADKELEMTMFILDVSKNANR